MPPFSYIAPIIRSRKSLIAQTGGCSTARAGRRAGTRSCSVRGTASTAKIWLPSGQTSEPSTSPAPRVDARARRTPSASRSRPGAYMRKRGITREVPTSATSPWNASPRVQPGQPRHGLEACRRRRRRPRRSPSCRPRARPSCSRAECGRVRPDDDRLARPRRRRSRRGGRPGSCGGPGRRADIRVGRRGEERRREVAPAAIELSWR